jgi:hypothetical protein
MTELIITEIQACDTQKDWYRFVNAASDDTRKGDKIYGRRKMWWRREPSGEDDGADREATAFDDDGDDDGDDDDDEDYHHHHLYDTAVHSVKIQRQVPVALKIKEYIFIL